MRLSVSLPAGECMAPPLHGGEHETNNMKIKSDSIRDAACRGMPQACGMLAVNMPHGPAL